MHRLRKFFRDFYESCVSFSFYGKLKQKEYGSGIGYFFALITLFSLIFTALEGVTVIQIGNDAIAEFTQSTPNNMEITVDHGTFQTNLKQPFIIRDFVVIDTTGSITSLVSRPESVLITATGMQIKKSEYEVREYSFKDMGSVHLTKQSILNFVSQYKTATALVFLLILFAVFWAGFAVLYLLYSLFFGFFGWLFVKTGGTSFGTVMSVSYHALTAPLIVSLVLNLFVMPVKYVVTLIFLVYFVNGLQQIQKRKTKHMT